MEPLLAVRDKKMFYKYLDKATIYFEYGSGGSTYQASIRNNINKIYSVESDLQWFLKVNKNVICDKLNLIYVDLQTARNTYGGPGPCCTDQDKILYSSQIKSVSSNSKIDLILIDGRFRVACCLKCFDIINNDCLIAFDDFLNRKEYHIVLQYYDIVEQTKDNIMVILKKKPGVGPVDKSLIDKYELIAL